MAGLNLPIALLVCAVLVYFYGKVQEVPDGLPSMLTANFRNGGPKTYRVTVDQGMFFINGLPRPNLVVNRGQTYHFNFNTPSTRIHPFYLSHLNEGGDNNYKGELINQHGVIGSRTTTGQLVWEVQDNYPFKEVYYHCGNHPHMGALIQIR